MDVVSSARLRWHAAVLAFVLSAQGFAENGEHWALVAPKRKAVPENAQPVDHYIRARLKAEGLSPSPRAPKYTLIRRLSFDLRGIPPAPEEVAQFITDPSPDAWPNLVERFLASPHFGERLAQNWLDLARYADTSGYAADRTRNMWVYRDWVIDAINRDKPFDEFTITQIAGDLLPQAGINDKIATGFHRNAMQAKGNNPKKEEFRVKTVVDRLETTGRTWLGLTLECAECHDHKHDPLSQKEYYQLFAIFNNVPHLGKGYGTHGPLLDFNPTASPEERPHLEQQIAALKKSLPKPRSPDSARLLYSRAGPNVVKDPKPQRVTSDLSITAWITTEDKVADLVSAYDWRGKQRSYVFGIGAEGEKNGTPGHLFAWISSKPDPWAGVEIYGSVPVNDGRKHHVALVCTPGRAVRLFVDGIEDKAARVMGAVPVAIAVSDRPLSIGAGFNNSAEPNDYKFNGTLGEVRIYGESLDDPGQLGEPAVRLAKLEEELSALGKGKAIKIPVMQELPTPRETHVHIRGNFKERGERVFPGAPAALPPIPGGPSANRLDFAKWLVQPDHPLTARVAVNYLWQHFFGTGLVATPADFGTLGEPPSHPDLLDWLAVEFVEQGWSRKHLVRLIVNSETYRQSSVTPSELRERDPANRLLARIPRLRHPAEQIRDNALAVSGLLIPTLGGPPVFPAQPGGLYEERGQNEAANSNFTWKNSEGDDRHRKSMYTYWKRMMLHPSLAAFDGPDRQVCTAKRSITNTPRQALVTLNDPIFHECARAFAKQIESAAENDDERIRFAFRTCLNRDLEAEELQRFRAFVREGGSDRWTSLATVLLNLDETLTRE